jgi:hypothetical protein
MVQTLNNLASAQIRDDNLARDFSWDSSRSDKSDGVLGRMKDHPATARFIGPPPLNHTSTNIPDCQATLVASGHCPIVV